MFSQIFRLLKHSAVYGMGHVLTRAVSFLLLPYLTHTLTPDEYGAVVLLYTYIALMFILYVYGFDVTFLRFYIMEKDEGRRKEVFSTIFWVSLATSALFSVIVGIFSGMLTTVVFENPESVGISARYLIILSTMVVVVETLGLFPFLYLRAVERSLPFIGLKTGGVVIHIVLTVLLISFLDRGVAGVFEANLIASALQLIVLIPLLIRNIRPKISFGKLKEFFIFGLPAMPSQIFVMAVELASRKILEIILGLTIVGIFSAGYRLGLFMAVVVMGFRFAWHPFFLSIADKPDAKETFSRIFTYFLLTTGTLFLLLAFTIKPLMTKPLPWVGTLIAESYWEGLKVFPIVLLAHICNGAYANFMVGVYIKKKTYLMPWITGVAAIVNIAGNIAFIPIFGMMAAAWMTLISYFLVAALLYFLIQPHYPIKYEWNRILLILLCGGFVYAVSLIPFLQEYWALKLLLIPVFGGTLIITRFFLPEEIAVLRRKLISRKEGQVK